MNVKVTDTDKDRYYCISKYIRQDGTKNLGCDESSGWIWCAGKVLAKHLLTQHEVMGMRILELGSGTGWLALTLSREGAIVTATERKGAMTLLTRNIFGYLERFHGESAGVEIQVEQLHWEEGPRLQQADYDIIIGSDLIYLPESHEPLIDTLILHKCNRFISTWEQRKPEEEEMFLLLALAKGFTFVPPQIVDINEATGNPILLLDMFYQG